MNKVVSIITPSFNRAYIVDETAQSIFNQTYPHWEWVITDDGSTDESWEKLQQYAASDSRVKIFRRDREPKGACVCRNISVERCTGDYVMFLDTDDVLASFCLEQRVKAMQENEDYDFVIFPMLLFKNKPDDTRIIWNIDKEEDDLSRILRGDAVCQGTGPLWKKTSFVSVGMWKEDLKLWQDIELHIRSLLYPVKYKKRLDLKPDVFLRTSDDSLSRVGYYSVPKMQSRISVYKDACSRVIEIGKYRQYAAPLKVMGIDVLVSAVKSGYYEGASEMIEVLQQHQIINNQELKKVKRYIAFSKAKLYKLPLLYKGVQQKVMDMGHAGDVTITSVKWTGEVAL